MNREEELRNEISECNSCIASLSNLMMTMYGSKQKDIEKNVMIKEYMKRLEKAKEELKKLESGDK